MNVYQIKTNLTEEKNLETIDNFNHNDIIIIDILSTKLISHDEIENGFITSYFICSENILEKIKELLNKYGVTFTVNDITKKFLWSLIKIENPDFNQYLKDKINIDIILDKINEMGIDSLTEEELKHLKSNDNI